jgi:hypothetical protein
MLAMPFVGKITGDAINRRNWQSSGNDQQGKSQKDNLDS